MNPRPTPVDYIIMSVLTILALTGIILFIIAAAKNAIVGGIGLIVLICLYINTWLYLREANSSNK